MLDTRGNIALACALSSLAGYVDGIGFIHLGGLFVSFMSGNSTRLGVKIAEGDFREALAAAELIGLFVAGAAAGSFIVVRPGPHRQAIVLLVEAVLLALAASFAVFDRAYLAIAAVVLAMGLENAVFQVRGGAGIGLTYVTGALVKVGQLLSAALTGGAPFAWLPNLALWASLVIGAVVGALVYERFLLGALWFSAAAAVVLAAIVAWTQRHDAN